MLRYFLAFFGLIGIAISIVEGVEPFIEVTKWVSWITENWVRLTRSIWRILFSIFQIQLRPEVYDFLTGLAYILSLLLVTRRVKGERDGPAYKLLDELTEFFDFLRIPDDLPRHVQFTAEFLLISFLMLPAFIVCFLLYLNSFWQSVSFIFFIFGVIILIFSEKYLVDGISEVVFGKPKSADEYPVQDNLFVMTISLPIAILAVVLAILLINEIAERGDNILAAYQLARCEAGIECDLE